MWRVPLDGDGCGAWIPHHKKCATLVQPESCDSVAASFSLVCLLCILPCSGKHTLPCSSSCTLSRVTLMHGYYLFHINAIVLVQGSLQETRNNAKRRIPAQRMYSTSGGQIETSPCPRVARDTSPKRGNTPHPSPSDAGTPKHAETAESTQFASRRRTESSTGRGIKAAVSSRLCRPSDFPSHSRTLPWKRGPFALGNGVFPCASSSRPLPWPRRSIPSPARCGHVGQECRDAMQLVRYGADIFRSRRV